jgi:hypothetical protein
MAAALDCAGTVPKTLAELTRVGSAVLALPFDMAREQYANSVRGGMLERSMTASARFEHWVSALERFTLGAMARRY